MTDEKYLFIDGAYLEEVVRDLSTRLWGPGVSVPIDYGHLGSGFSKVFYYNCPPPPAPNESDPQALSREAAYVARIDALMEIPGWRIFEGTVKRQRKRGHTQKEVDVQLAVDLLTHAFRKNTSRVTLLAGDVDFRPVVEAVAREGLHIAVWSDKASSSRELRQAADERIAFDFGSLEQYRERAVAVPFAVPIRHVAPRPTIKETQAEVTGTAVDGHVGPFYMIQDAIAAWRVCNAMECAPGKFEWWFSEEPEALMAYLRVLYGEINWTQRAE